MVKEVIKRGNIIVKEHRKELFQVFLLILIVESLQSMSVLFGLLGILVSILTISLRHVQAVVGLKAVQYKDEAIHPNDGLCFIKRFKELFSTYFWMALIHTVIVVVLTMIAFELIVALVDEPTTKMLLEQVVLEQSYGVNDLSYHLAVYVLSISMLVGLLSTFVTDCLCFMAPFVLEVKGLHGFKAIKQGWQLSKGHWRKIIHLEAYYLVPIILFAGLDFLATYYLIDYSMVLQMTSIMLEILAVFAYRMELMVSRALLYVEVEEQKIYG